MKTVDIVNQNVKGDDVIPYMCEIDLVGNQQDAFLKVRETLTRIGVSSSDELTLYQTCHILQKRSKFYIVPYKILFMLDGRDNGLTFNDIARSNRITSLLEEWGLIKVKNPEMITYPQCTLYNICVVKYSDKHTWNLSPKYTIGKKK